MNIGFTTTALKECLWMSPVHRPETLSGPLTFNTNNQALSMPEQINHFHSDTWEITNQPGHPR